MASVKERYAAVVREKKKYVKTVTANVERSKEEQRVFDVFKRHAKEDYGTLSKHYPLRDGTKG